MFEPTDPEVLWLNLTNIGLGLVTLICLAVVGVVIFREITARARSRARVTVANDDHAFVFPELGVTMADGGERIDEKKRLHPTNDNRSDESNIIRSEN